MSSATAQDREVALLGAIDDAEEHSYGSDSNGELSNQRAKALDYYLGRMPSAPDGRSQVVDRTVKESIDWMLPSLSRIFANGDNVVELPPIGPEDEESAKQESEYLNFLLLQKNNWFQIFNTGAKDALITKAGYLWAYPEDVRQVEPESYKRQTQESVALIMQDKPEVLSINEYPDEDEQPQPMVDPATGQPVIGPDGQPVMQPPTMLYDLEIRRTKTERKYCVVPLPPERCKVAESHNEVQLEGCPYFEYYDFCTISYLRTLGLEVTDDISESATADTEEDTARDIYSESTWDSGQSNDPAMRRVKTRWIWITYDYDGDGISELNHVIRVGQTILHREEVNEIPVGVLCPDPLPHRHVGLSVADSAIDLQDISTSILRQGMDNLYLSQNPQKFGDPSKVNLDDMMISRPGGITRIKNGAIFGQDFGVYAVPNVFADAIGALEFFKQKGEDRTGVGRYFTGTDANALNKTATGVNQLTTMSAQRVEQIARYFANGIESLCRVLHGLVLKGGHRQEVVKLRGKWVTVDPSTWRSRKDFRICVGYSAGNKDSQMARLSNIALFQEKAMAGGLPIVRPENLYETAIEITKASDFSRPERFWTDPSNIPPPPPPQPDVTVVAMEQIKAQSAANIKQMENQSNEAVNQLKAEVDKYKADLASQTTLIVEQMKQQNAVALKDKDAETQTKLKNMDARKSDDEVTGVRVRAQSAEERAGELEQQVNQAVQTIQAVQERLGSVVTASKRINRIGGRAESSDALDAEGNVLFTKRIKRGKDGSPEMVETVTPSGEVIASQQVVRGKDGRLAGVQ